MFAPTVGPVRVAAVGWKFGASATRPILAASASRSTIPGTRITPRPKAAWSSRERPASPNRRPSRSHHPLRSRSSSAQHVHGRATVRRAMAFPRPADAGPDRGRSGQPGRYLRNDHGAPARPAAAAGEPPSFHTDPIALDTFTHLLGCWGLDCLEQGDVIFPLRMGRLSILERPPRRDADRMPDPGP